MDDVISRKQAVEAMYALVDGCVCDDEWRENPHIDAIVDTLENLPSAQPNYVVMSDLISRREAIDALIRISGCESKNEIIGICAESVTDGEGWIGGILDSISELEDLPSAEPERKKGKWIYNSPVTMKCDQCGLVIKDWDWNRFKYCPNCCSDMRGERE